MGEARRKKLMERRLEKKLAVADAKLARSDKALARADEHLAEIRADLLRLRKEWDSMSLPWQENMELFANREGPGIFPKEDERVARFIVRSQVSRWKTGFSFDKREPTEDELAELAEILEPFLLKKPDVLARGLEHLRRLIQMEIDLGNLDPNDAAMPTEERHISMMLSSLYARRMLREDDDEGWRPFVDINFEKYMTPGQMELLAKSGAKAYLQAEDSLRGDAAESRDRFNRLTDDKKELIRDIVFGIPKSAHDRIFASIERQHYGKSPELQLIYEITLKECTEPSWLMDKRQIDASAGMFAFAMAKMFLRELTVTPAEMLEGVDRLGEQELRGEAAKARDRYYALPIEDQRRYDDIAASLPRENIDKVISIVDEIPRAKDILQTVFEATKVQTLHMDNRLHNVADIHAFATARMIFKELMNKKPSLASRSIEPATNRLKTLAKHAAALDAPDGKEGVVVNFTQRIWTDEELTTVGVKLWELTYKVGKGDKEVDQASQAVAAQWAKDRQEPEGSRRLVVIQDIIAFSAKWAVHAFQRITTTHTYAAALMCSDADKQVIREIEMQYSAFMVCLPNGLLSYTDGEGIAHEYNRILVSRFDDRASMILLNQHGSWSGPNLFVSIAPTLAEVLALDDSIEAGNVAVSEEDSAKFARIVILAKRLVAGLMLAMQTRTNFKATVRPGKSGKKKREADEPEHRVVFVGVPLKIDCRPNITDYIEHGSSKRKGAPPQVQTLVRGHYRRQVCGVGRLERKTIWIEPFWRGPEDAPILTRPKAVVRE